MADIVRHGLAFCVPRSGKAVPSEWAFALKFMDFPINMFGVYHSPLGLPVDEARNSCVEFAREQKSKYLFFLDEDTVPPTETVRKFVYLMENNPGIDVLGGVYFSKCMPPAPLVFRGNGAGSYWDWKIGEMFWCTGLGMGCTMIRMSVFDKIEKPYFLTVKADGHIDNVHKVEAWTEDLYFCEKVLKAYGWNNSLQAIEPKENIPENKPIWCDAATQCDHHDIGSGQVFRLPPNSKPAQRRMAVGDKKILDIGCGEIATILKDGSPVRFDMRDDVNADYRGDARCLPFETESFDVVFSSHTLEHFSRKQVPEVLDEWLRVLRVDGELRLIVPDLTVAAGEILNNEISDVTLNVLYGEQNVGWNYHKIGFTPVTLKALLESKGLEVIKIWSEKPFNLFTEARKKKASEFVGTGQGRPILKEDASVSSQVVNDKLVTTL